MLSHVLVECLMQHKAEKEAGEKKRVIEKVFDKATRLPVTYFSQLQT